ncbi:MAG TPA: hypothetical protein VH596_08625 [Terriglobales bacterium]|jgi:hypothetical protein
MLTLAESENIVKDCVREATRFSGTIRSENKLYEIGVIDDDSLDAVNEEITTNPEKGVPNKHYEIDPAVLPTTTDKTVAEVRDIVQENAVELSKSTKAAFVRMQALVRAAERSSGGKRR